ncbi:hypothetical protein ACFX12_036836 [Malus domestica]
MMADKVLVVVVTKAVDVVVDMEVAIVAANVVEVAVVIVTPKAVMMVAWAMIKAAKASPSLAKHIYLV